jgi:hypothetical protein
MNRFKLSWEALRASTRLVRDHRALRGLALLMAVAWVGSLVVVFGPLLYIAFEEDREWLIPVVTLVTAYPLTFMTVFLGVAIVRAAVHAETGRELSTREALGEAWERRRQIAAWSLLSAGVGVLLEQVVRRIPFAGRITAWLAGAAWSLATLFAIPILALEGCGATECARRSARTFRSRWGEGIVGSVSIAACLVVPAMIAAVLIGAGAGAGADSVAAIAAITVGVALLGLVSAAGTVMRNLFALVLYRYATTGTASLGFEQLQMEEALKLKPAKPRWLGGRRREPNGRR